MTLLLDSIGLGLIIPVVPAVLRQITGADISHASVYGGWLFFAYAAMQFFCAPVVGALSDAIGRRPVLLASVLGLGVDYALTALSPSIAWLFVGRLVAGLFGASYTTANAYIADVSTPEERGKAFGLMGAAFGIGFVVGPAIGGLLGDMGPRVPFFVASGLSIANFLYGAIALPETHPQEKRKPMQLSQVSPLGALREIPGGKNVRVLAFALFVQFLAQAVYPAVWSFWSSATFDWDPRMIGISLAAYGVSNTITQAVLVGRWTKAWGERKAALVALFLNVLNFVLTGLATKSWMAFAIIVVASPAGVALPAMNAWMSKLAPADAQGRLQGTIGAAEGLSSIFGPILMTQTFERFFPGAPFFVAAALALVSFFIATRAVAPPPSAESVSP